MTASPEKGSLDTLAVFVATAGGAGFVPAAPGTAGALVGVILYLLTGANGMGILYLSLLAVLTILGTWSASRVEAIYGHDASKIVIDEVVGQMLALGFVVRTDSPALAASTILGFLLFRFFDILKPFPIRRLERFPGGVGVMADDIGAGVYAFLVLVAAERFVLEIV